MTSNFISGKAEQSYRNPVQIQLNSPSTTPGYFIDPTVSGTSSNFLVDYTKIQGLTYPPGTEVCVDKVSYVNSVFNISASLGNNQIGYNIGGSGGAIFTIPDGNYGVTDISAFLQNAITENGDDGSNITLTIDLIRIRTVLFVTNSYELDLTQGTLWQQLGAEGPETYYESGEFENYVNIFQTNALMFNFPNLNSSFSSMLNGASSSSIYTSFITVGPGYQQNDNPPSKVWFPLGISKIPNITVQITDQNGQPIDLNGQPVNILLRFRNQKRPN